VTRPSLSLLDQLSPEGRTRFEKAAVVHRFARGVTPILKGEAITGAYIVARGRLRVAAMSAEGREATLYAIAPGETCVLAINALFKALPYPGTVVAEEDTEVLFVPGTTWRALFATESAIQNMTLEALSVAVMRLMEALESVHAQPLRQRLVALLHARADSSGRVMLTQAEIAAELGTAREVVARHLAALRRAGKVAGAHGKIEVVRG
jgi:CRP/FNR family transcriptional regulator